MKTKIKRRYNNVYAVISDIGAILALVGIVGRVDITLGVACGFMSLIAGNSSRVIELEREVRKLKRKN